MLNRSSGPAGALGTAAVTGFAVTAVLMCCTAPHSHVTEVMLVDATESVCDAKAMCPADPAPDSGDQATAEQRVIDGYIAKQKGCTPDTPPNPRSVTWDPPGFTPNMGGTGVVNDTDPRLGGQFRADWVNGRWRIEYPYC